MRIVPRRRNQERKGMNGDAEKLRQPKKDEDQQEHQDFLVKKKKQNKNWFHLALSSKHRPESLLSPLIET